MKFCEDADITTFDATGCSRSLLPEQLQPTPQTGRASSVTAGPGRGLGGLGDHREHARYQFGFRDAAVGEPRVVGEIDIARVGTSLHYLAEHGEPAEAGIENENRRMISARHLMDS